MNVKPFSNLILMEIQRSRGMSPTSQLKNLALTEVKIIHLQTLGQKIQIQDDRLDALSPYPIKCCL